MPITNGANTATLRWPRFLWTPANSNTTSISHHPWLKKGTGARPGTSQHSAGPATVDHHSWGHDPRRRTIRPGLAGHLGVEGIERRGDRGWSKLHDRRL